MKNLSATQKQSENSKLLQQQFIATSNLSNALRPQQKREQTSKILMSTGKELLRQAKIEKINEKLNYGQKKQEITLESEVIQLNTYQKPVYNPHVEQMIAKQRESRRERHLQTLVEFEEWIENLFKDTENNYEDIKYDIQDYFKESDQEIQKYFSDITDGYLMSREKDLLGEMQETIDSHRQKRLQKVKNLDQRLEENEKERESNINFFCTNLTQTLTDIAFILEPEVIKLTSEKKQSFSEVVKKNRELNLSYVKEVNDKQAEAFKQFEILRQEKERRWRELQHNEALRQFKVEISQMEYVNPEERKVLYEDLKQKQISVYSKRKVFVERLMECEIQYLSKASLEKWIQDIKSYNEQVQKMYDESFEQIIKESESSKQKGLNRFAELRSRLEYIEFQTGEELERLLSSECMSVVNGQFESNRAQITAAMKFIEDSDLKTHELLLNLGRFYKKIGIKIDEYKTAAIKMLSQYEYEKAKVADQNDENIETMQVGLEKLKADIMKAEHHPKLTEQLNVCFEQVDKLEKEYRDFHERNQLLVKNHPKLILDFIQSSEQKCLPIFSLVDLGKRAELEAKYKQNAEYAAKKQLAKEEKLKQLEEEKEALAQAQDTSKKSTKKAAPKKVDPKKQQQEQEQRYQEILKSTPIEQVQIYKTQMGTEWIIEMPVIELSKKLYEVQDEDKLNEEESKQQILEQKQEQKEPDDDNKKSDQQQGQTKGKVAQPEKQDKPGIKGKQEDKAADEPEIVVDLDEKPPIPVDFKEDSPVDPENNKLFEKNVIIELTFVESCITKLREDLFQFFKLKFDQHTAEAKTQDRDFMENSILILDERLKAHYPLKGKIEVELYQERSAQITKHKKNYEMHARKAIDTIDQQTEYFNFLMETGLQDTKDYEQQQKKATEDLQSAQTLAKLQGLQNQVRENSFKFAQKICYLNDKVKWLANDQLDALSQQNIDYIKEFGPEYSEQEVAWYTSMMKDIDGQLVQQKLKRQERAKELQIYMEKRKEDLVKSFEDAYAMTIEDLAAKDGTGKKYGRPRRYAQERIRNEMNKCEKAQESIQNQLKQIRDLHEEYQLIKEKKEIGSKETEVFQFRVRKVLMSLRTTIMRYSKHIEAFKPDAKVGDMKRVTYIEAKFDCWLDPAEAESDKQRLENEQMEIGPLFYQKEAKNFMEWVLEIEKNVISEAQKIYVGDKSKFLTGADKLPDYLRDYLNNMKKKANEFKIACIRNLRNSCEELGQLSPQISEMCFESIQLKYASSIADKSNECSREFVRLYEETKASEQLHLKLFRPNLSNPLCKAELDDLLEKEKNRLQKFLSQIQITKEKVLTIEFDQSNLFFKALLNCFEFLISYFDAEVLFEDFVKLPGDDDVQKKHLNLKQLMRMKQNGTIIDTNSERSLSKVWPGLAIHSFQVGTKQVAYEIGPGAEEPDKGKKGDKKGKPQAQGKAQTAQIDPQQQQLSGDEQNTKPIKSFKTFRQKAAYQCRNKIFTHFKKRFDESVDSIAKYFEAIQVEEMKFEFKWEQNIALLKTF